MRLIQRPEARQPGARLRAIAISQAEITADLLYPASRARPRRARGRRAARRGPVSGDGVVLAGEAQRGRVRRSLRRRQPRDLAQPHPGLAGPGGDRGAGGEMSGMEYMAAIVAGELPPPPIAVTMRLRPIELEEGRVVFEGEPGEEHYNPIGVVHGGYAATLLDSALGCAVHTTLPAGVGYTSLGLEAKYRAPDHPRHRPRPLRGDRPPPRPPPGDRRGAPDRGRRAASCSPTAPRPA